MNIIVAVDKNWGIGKGNDLLFRIGEDLKNFKKHTQGKIVVMGRKTLESLPKGRPLPNRTNIVLSTSELMGDVLVVHNLDELFSNLKSYNSDDVYVIGGERIYEQLLPYMTTAYVTLVDGIGDADRFFPNLDSKPEWTMVEKGETMEENGVKFSYSEWKNANVSKI